MVRGGKKCQNQSVGIVSLNRLWIGLSLVKNCFQGGQMESDSLEFRECFDVD